MITKYPVLEKEYFLAFFCNLDIVKLNIEGISLPTFDALSKL
jgi:hypothetical protein